MVDAQAIIQTFILIIAWGVLIIDAIRLQSQQKVAENVGLLNDGGWAWRTTWQHEFIRRGPDLITCGFMAILPWLFRSLTDPGWTILILWSTALVSFALLMLLPRRYAVTRTTLFADGWGIDWERLGSLRRRHPDRIVLQRKGWWLFAPLALGGSKEDLDEVEKRIIAAFGDMWVAEGDE